MNNLRVGILQVGDTKCEMKNNFADYPSLLTNLISSKFKQKVISHTYAIKEFKKPKNLTDNDVYIISGSKASVYDDYSWIGFLAELIEKIMDQKIKLIGVCFGHQIIAKVLGGKVKRVGWSIGIKKYQIKQKPTWIEDKISCLNFLAIHQDQVVELPKNVGLWATSQSCPNAGLFVDNRIFTIQSHPEFSKAYLETLLSLIQFKRFTQSQYQKAIASLNQSIDNDLFRIWLKKFINS